MDPTVALPRGAKSKVKKATAAADGDGGSAPPSEVLVHSVDEVYIYIPAELSAAGYELKIRGSVKIVDKVSLCGVHQLELLFPDPPLVECGFDLVC